MTRDIYDPQLIPERRVRADKEGFITMIRGYDYSGRYGEEYIMSCHCGGLLITSEIEKCGKFTNAHKDH